MQPLELTLEGFTAYPRRTTVDFADARLFALLGATGAGKSSLVDALCFALYGRVPRLGARQIAPLLSSGLTECTVSLVFTVRGRRFRAVRQARRTPTGATTGEAVLDELDRDGAEVATRAGTADDVTREVERLLGLRFEEFTRTVVLPQNEFARFLSARPSERRELLSRLLGTEIYERVMRSANSHAKLAEQRADMVETQIAKLGPVGPDQVAAAGRRVGRLDDLVESLRDDQQTLEAARAEHATHAAARDEAHRWVQRLTAIPPLPDDVRDLAQRIASIDEQVAKLAAARHDAEEAAEQATTALRTLGDPQTLTAAINARARVADLRQAATAHNNRIAELSARLDTVQRQERVAVTAAAAAAETLTGLRRTHAAAEAAHGLHAGDDCPVCARPLDADPAPRRPDDLVAAERDAREAARNADRLSATREHVTADLAAARAAATDAQAAVAEAEALVADLPAIDEAQAALERIAAAQAGADRLASEARDARRDHQESVRRRAAVDAEERTARQRLDQLRLSVAELDPPEAQDGLGRAWERLAGWAAASLPRWERAAQESEAALAGVRERGAAVRARMDAACRDAGVAPDGKEPLHAAIAAQASAVADLRQLEARSAEAEALAAEEEQARAEQVVGRELGQLLKSDAFQQWLLDEATRRLVAGASEHLLTLSSDRYQLAAAGKEFMVVDLANAGARRSVRTLSGGETFLASLALALSLADEIATSASGPVAMESLFLDEGFGSLDPETLDVVAGAIEQLGSEDRMVGLITHVRDLADRVPTRFEVRAGPGGATVERIDA